MDAAIYARVSTEKQEKQETVKSQLEALRDFAAQNKYSIYAEYIDDGYSGELLNRPNLDELRDAVKNNLFDVVLVHSPDRLSRIYAHQYLIKEEFKKFGIRIVFLNMPDSKDTPDENLLIGIQSLIAEFEKAKILERTRRGKIHKAKNNSIVGSIPPYGYRYVCGDKNKKIDGYYEVIESEAEVVKLIFGLFVKQKYSIRAIAKELTKRGIRPKRGKNWRTSSLHKIIRNETYVGVTYYNKHMSVETDNTAKKYRRQKKTGRILRDKKQWIPIILPEKLQIIDKHFFNLAQKQLSINAKLSPRNTKNEYLLRGMIKCGNCEAPFHGTPCHGKLYYQCGNKHRTFPLPRECKVPMVKASTLDDIVWDKVCEAIKNPRLITNQIAKLKGKAVKNRFNIENDIKSIMKDFKSTELKENRLLDAYRENVIDMEQLKEQMMKIKVKKEQLQKDQQTLIDRQKATISTISVNRTLRDYLKLIRNRLDIINGDFESKRYLLSLAVNEVILKDNTVSIKGIIPTNTQEKQVDCNIASQSSARYVPLRQRPQTPVWHAPVL
jgi:site-specific DNA recombinase